MGPHLRGRRRFARLALASAVSFIACDGGAPEAKDQVLEELVPPAPASPVAAPSPPPLPPPLDFELERRFSPPVYADLAFLIIPYAKLDRDASGASRSSELQALELDFEDDSPDRLQSLAPAAMPTAVPDAELDVGHAGVAILTATGRQPEIRLLGVRIGSDGRKHCATWVSRALRKGKVIVSSDQWGETRAGALVLLPDDGIVLNAELLRHGFARLDLEHAEVLRSFPLLVDAAWGALESRTGLARDWHEDQDYVAAVAALR
jgi:hypothetical protein